MRYRVLLKFLQVLVYIKRFFWWLGNGVYFVLAKIIGFFTRGYLYSKLAIGLGLRRIGISQGSQWFYKRDVVQIIVFLVLFGTTINQTKLVPKLDLSFVGQKTLAYSLVGGEEDAQTEEVVSNNTVVSNAYSWKTGVINVSEGEGNVIDGGQDLGVVVAGGTALSKPTIIPGATITTSNRNEVTEYVVETGDSIGGIARDFGVSVATVLWENNLNARSIIRPGDTLKIPPTSGVMHTIKKGDTIQKIAKLYGADAAAIIAFNSLKEDGSDLHSGERIMVPNGSRADAPAAAPVSRPGRTATTLARQAAPPNSAAAPGAAGFVWPTASHIITQYFGFQHHALDIAGPWQSPIYAAKAGTVVIAQCGWNFGYGCYIVIDHGGGIRTLYGHNSQLLVSAGDEVDTGQTIALMGNTGHVRGVTGIHSHFEVQVNGVRVNPLGYVR